MARLLLLTHEFQPFRGGIAAVVDGLARGSAAVGHSPVVFAPDYGADQDETDRIQPYEVQRFSGSTCSMLSTDKLARFTGRCSAMIRKVKPDLVHAVDPASQMALAMLGRLRRVRNHVFTVHGTELVRYRNELFPRLWMGRGMCRATSVHAVSHAVERLLRSGWRRGLKHAFVETPGIGQGWLERPVTDRNVTRVEWKATPDDLVLLTLARRVPEKGHQDVIASVALLPDELRSRVVYVVMGTGPDSYASSLEVAAADAKVRLVLAGAVSDDQAVAACDAADLLVMLSRRTETRIEGFGIAYIEAAARGLASLARSTGGVAEAVHDGRTGLVLAPDATNDTVARALETLLLSPSLRNRLGDGGRTLARGFSWEARAGAIYERFLARVADGAPRSSS